jgi:hypothetical protein
MRVVEEWPVDELDHRPGRSGIRDRRRLPLDPRAKSSSGPTSTATGRIGARSLTSILPVADADAARGGRLAGCLGVAMAWPAWLPARFASATSFCFDGAFATDFFATGMT